MIKRFLPFALTLAVGIFIASFFVTLTTPKFRFEPRYQYCNECRLNKKAERARIKRERCNPEFQTRDELVPPPPLGQAIPFENFAVKPPVAPNVPY